jgi:hypothetical protein
MNMSFSKVLCCALKKANAQGSLQPCGLSLPFGVQVVSLLPRYRVPHASLLIVPLKVQRRHGNCLKLPYLPFDIETRQSRYCAIWVSRSATRLSLLTMLRLDVIHDTLRYILQPLKKVVHNRRSSSQLFVADQRSHLQ